MLQKRDQMDKKKIFCGENNKNELIFEFKNKYILAIIYLTIYLTTIMVHVRLNQS